MTRIIAGAARGRRLKVPAEHTRPTSDRVREALFSSLQAAIDLRGVEVLDLFAGSGALGLEALSRGAERVVLVDQSSSAVRVMSQNIGTVSLPGATVSKSTAAQYLHDTPRPYDVVFLDPPYSVESAAVDALLTCLTQGWLAADAVVVVERAARSDALCWPERLEPDWNRRFGDTHVTRAVWYGHQQNR